MDIFQKSNPRIEIRRGGIEQALAKGSNASNGWTSIWIWSDIPHMAATLAQEVREYEWRRAKGLRWGLAALLVSGLAAYLAFGLYGAPAAILATFLAVGLSNKTGDRTMELMGHAVEVLVAAEWYGLDIEEREVRSLQLYDEFRGEPADKILADMRERYPDARKWIAKRRAFIQRAYEYRYPGAL
jgi:hypothetical protein